jgi:hypothetical protein
MSEAWSFDATTVEPAKPREGGTIPDGWYKAWITETDYRDNAKQTGKLLEMTWEVLEGEHKGWHIWDRQNVKHPNETAQRIAQEAMSAICHAIDVLKPKHHGQLAGKACMIKVVTKPGDAKKDLQGNVLKDERGVTITHPPRNEIKGYLPVGDPGVPAQARPKVGAGAVGAVPGARADALKDDDDDLPF